MSTTADQARLRRERREAKIKAGGSARLNKITGLGGGLQDSEYLQAAHGSLQTDVIQAAAHIDDPAEVDISDQQFGIPNMRPSPMSTAGFTRRDNFGPARAKMNFDHQVVPNSFMSSPNLNGSNIEELMQGDDPMLKTLRDLLATAGVAPGGLLPNASMTPGRAHNLTEPLPQDTGYAHVWRIVHAMFAICFGLYVASVAECSGSKMERDLSLSMGNLHLFYIFATMETVLQSSRIFLDSSSTQPVGILGTIISILPMPWNTYARLVLRYAKIWTTTSIDAMTCIFVLGLSYWWSGFGGS